MASFLFNLSEELIVDLFLALDTNKTVYSLAATCKYLYYLSKDQYIKKRVLVELSQNMTSIYDFERRLSKSYNNVRYSLVAHEIAGHLALQKPYNLEKCMIYACFIDNEQLVEEVFKCSVSQSLKIQRQVAKAYLREYKKEPDSEKYLHLFKDESCLPLDKQIACRLVNMRDLEGLRAMCMEAKKYAICRIINMGDVEFFKSICEEDINYALNWYTYSYASKEICQYIIDTYPIQICADKDIIFENGNLILINMAIREGLLSWDDPEAICYIQNCDDPDIVAHLLRTTTYGKGHTNNIIGNALYGAASNGNALTISYILDYISDANEYDTEEPKLIDFYIKIIDGAISGGYKDIFMAYWSRIDTIRASVLPYILKSCFRSRRAEIFNIILENPKVSNAAILENTLKSIMTSKYIEDHFASAINLKLLSSKKRRVY